MAWNNSFDGGISYYIIIVDVREEVPALVEFNQKKVPLSIESGVPFSINFLREVPKDCRLD